MTMRGGLSLLGRAAVFGCVVGGAFVAGASAASAESIRVAVSNGSPAAGAAFVVTATALNASGQVDRTFNASASWSDSSASLSPGSPTNFVNGVSKTTGVEVADPHHADRITVQTGSLTGISAPFNVTGPLTHFVFGGVPTVAQNQPFTVTVRAEDALNDVITSYSGSPTWSDLSGSLSPLAPAVFGKGVSSTTARVADVEQKDKITITDATAGVQSSSGAFNVTVPPAFTTPGTYSYTVPAGVTSITVTVVGAAGAGCVLAGGGRGASVVATVAVSPREQLNVGVGGVGGDCNSGGAGGIGGGGSGGSGNVSTGGGGGGGSLIGVGFPFFDWSPLVVAAGGGGTSDLGPQGVSGAGDADSPGSPTSGCGPGTSLGCGGQSGTSSGGGAGGEADNSGDGPGAAGQLVAGGAGGSTTVPGGGGGGGYYGGGGGGGGSTGGGGGGGGASFIVPGASVVSGPTPTSAAAEVAISYP